MKARLYNAFVSAAGAIEAIVLMLIGMFGGTSVPVNKVEAKAKKRIKKG